MTPLAPMDCFFRELSREKTAPLSLAECRALYRRLRRGDPAVRRRFLTSAYFSVVREAKRHQGRGLELEDLCQLGFLGLLRALDKYNPTKGANFNTFAGWDIRAKIQEGLKNQALTIRVPAPQQEADRQAMQFAERFAAQRGRAPREEELAAGLGWTAGELARWQQGQIARQTESIHKPAQDQGDRPYTAEPVLETECAVEALEEREALVGRLEWALAQLPKPQRRVLLYRFTGESRSRRQGATKGRARTLEEVGAILGVTRERVRQIEGQALKKMRALMGSG